MTSQRNNHLNISDKTSCTRGASWKKRQVVVETAFSSTIFETFCTCMRKLIFISNKVGKPNKFHMKYHYTTYNSNGIRFPWYFCHRVTNPVSEFDTIFSKPQKTDEK